VPSVPDAWSPMIDLAGQIAKIGQRLQPTATATGQIVMAKALVAGHSV
jgi:hypothetical protein